MNNLKFGYSRVVVLVGGIAIKFPRPTSIKSLAVGFAANLEEALIWLRFGGGAGICPVLFWTPLFSVMQRARMLVEAEYDEADVLSRLSGRGYRVDVESGRRNFGVVSGEMVTVDYASNYGDILRYLKGKVEKLTSANKVWNGDVERNN